MITKRNAYNKADCAKMYPNVLDKFMITFTANDKRQFVSPCDQFFFPLLVVWLSLCNCTSCDFN